MIVDFSPDAAEDGPGPPLRHRIAATEMIRMVEAAGLRNVAHERLRYHYAIAFTRE